MSPVLTDLISVYPTRSVIEFTISGMARTGRLRVTDSSKSGFREHRGQELGRIARNHRRGSIDASTRFRMAIDSEP
jgi:hypothetical protein